MLFAVRKFMLFLRRNKFEEHKKEMENVVANTYFEPPGENGVGIIKNRLLDDKREN